jgi:Domain of unknown function (DU1801)
MQPTDAGVDAYIETIPNPARRTDARALCRILAEITSDTPTLWGTSIIGFGSYRYRYASGHEGTAPLASFSPRAAHLVIYLVGGFAERHRRLLQRLGPHKTSRGCLYVRRLEDVDTDVLRQLVIRSIKVHLGQDRVASRGTSP